MTHRYKVVSIVKQPNTPLGLTVEQDQNGNVIIARVLAGSTIDQENLMYAGDVIQEVNGIIVRSAEELTEIVSQSKSTLHFRIASKNDIDQAFKPHHCYVRTLFNYNPQEDSLLPCQELGLSFKMGDVLQIVDQKDPIWWQARKVEEDGAIGLIPSSDLEERRKAYVPPEADYVHKIGICGTRIARRKHKKMYQSKWNVEFDKADLCLYEEVTKMRPFKRRTLALIGPPAVGRRTLKGRLINSNPDKFSGATPVTSRPQREYEDNGKNYWFLVREDMEKQIKQHKFLEYGEYNGHLYGTSLDSIRNTISEGKMCVLDCSPSALKILHNSVEFMPYVIFIAAPGIESLKTLYDYGRCNGYSTRTLTFDRQSSIRYSSCRAKTLESLASLYEEDDLKKTVEESSYLQRTYEKYIDTVIVNENMDKTFLQIVKVLETLANQYQWIPINWVY